MAAKKEAAEAGEKKGGGSLKLIIILVVALALLGGGGFAAWKFLLQPKSENSSAEGHEASAPAEPAKEEAKGETKGEAKGRGGEGQASEGKGGEGKSEAGAALEVVKFEPFVVNLADPMGRRYLKLTMEVEVATGTSAALEAALPKVKDSLLLLLSSKFYSEISSMDQKLELKSEIMERLSQVVGKGKIKNVYFTEFVIQ